MRGEREKERRKREREREREREGELRYSESSRELRASDSKVNST